MATQNSTYFSDQMTKGGSKPRNQDQDAMPRVNGALLTQIQNEFTTMSNELGRLHEIIRENSNHNLTSFLSTHLQKFNEFKDKVVSALDAWHLKSTQLGQLTTKYMDTLEEYKMMFV